MNEDGQQEALYYGGLYRGDGKLEVWLRDHMGRDLGRFILPESKPEDQDLKVVFTHHGQSRHSLKVDWLPVLTMIPGWPWRWLRIKREVRNLWRMLRR